MQQKTSLAIRNSLPAIAKYTAAAIAGAFTWSMVQSSAQVDAVKEAPSLPILLALQVERDIHDLEKSATPQAAVAAARSIDQLRFVMTSSFGSSYPDAQNTRAFVTELNALDLTGVIGKLDPSCEQKAAAGCSLKYGANGASQPDAAEVSRMLATLSNHDLQAKAYGAAKEMALAHSFMQPTSSGFSSQHPVLAAVNRAAMAVHSSVFDSVKI